MDSRDRYLPELDLVTISKGSIFLGSCLAGETAGQTLSLMEQLRGEALKFHKPGE
jgi:hypothetical protein